MLTKDWKYRVGRGLQPTKFLKYILKCEAETGISIGLETWRSVGVLLKKKTSLMEGMDIFISREPLLMNLYLLLTFYSKY